MKKIAFIAAAATVALMHPASAQGVSVGVGESGVRVGVDRPHHHERHYHRRHDDSRAHYRDGDTVVIRKHRHWDRDRYHRAPRKTVIIER